MTAHSDGTFSDDEITSAFIAEVSQRLASGNSVRKSLPGGGLLSIDRQLPFLCVYRRDPNLVDAGTRSFADHEASYLSAPGNFHIRSGLKPLVRTLIDGSSQRFGTSLILEVRSAPDADVARPANPHTGENQLPAPQFRINVNADCCSTNTVNTLRSGLENIRVGHQLAKVDVFLNDHSYPPGMRPLLSIAEQQELNCHVIGLEILPIFRDQATGAVLPDVLREMQRKVSRVLKKTFYSFTVNHTSFHPHDYYSLGRRRISRFVWEVDQLLSDVSQRVDLLLLATPINVQTAWSAFSDGQFRTKPVFQTRPLPFDPFVLKRELMDVKVERVNDPTLAHLFREVQSELDRQLTMLTDIGNRRFLHGSLQVFGEVEPSLLDSAQQLLSLTDGYDAASEATKIMGPVAFARRAESALESYRKRDPGFTASVELRDDLYSGLMVCGTRFLIGRGFSVPSRRVKALLAHEVGTHLVTRHNGMQQPMKLLQTGLAGYDPMQEGLAVLAEYLVGGLSVVRLRLLAARVLATHVMIKGTGFSDTFRLLYATHGFEQETAFTMTMRVFRGGGLTKDAAYLRGFNQILKYLSGGGDLLPLYVGKLAASHIPLIKELLSREVLAPAAVVPTFLETQSAQAALNRVRVFGDAVSFAAHLVGLP